MPRIQKRKDYKDIDQQKLWTRLWRLQDYDLDVMVMQEIWKFISPGQIDEGS